MRHEIYIKIKEYLRTLIMGTDWEGHVYTVGGCVRDELMGSEIKDIDLCVSLPSGGIRFAEWLCDNGYTMYTNVSTGEIVDITGKGVEDMRRECVPLGTR